MAEYSFLLKRRKKVFLFIERKELIFVEREGFTPSSNFQAT